MCIISIKNYVFSVYEKIHGNYVILSKIFFFGRRNSIYEKTLFIDSSTEYALPVDQRVQDTAGIGTQHCCGFSGGY